MFQFTTTNVQDPTKFTTNNKEVKTYCTKNDNIKTTKWEVEEGDDFKYFVSISLLPQKMVRQNGKELKFEDKIVKLSGPNCDEMFIKFVS
jgi:hypothetical protein